ncbi:N-acetylmuramoyl-L-alanine amidase, partial [Acidobacteriota bacterium]
TVMNPPGRLILRLNAEGIRSGAESLAINDGAVKSVVFRGGAERGTFVVNLDRSFKDFRISEFTDPFRIMLDVERTDRYTSGGSTLPTPAPTPFEMPSLPEPTKPPYPERKPKPFRVVVLDPGHGGQEVGAKGPTGLLEKDVTLQVAHILKKMLETNLGVQVRLTRESDVDLSLQERTALANYQKADLFLSLHCNASRRQNARGAETYFMSYKATDEESGRLAQFENNPLGGSSMGNQLTDLELILWDMAQTQYLQESEQFAEAVNYELSKTLNLKDRGVKQAPFAVLAGAAMPAVLVEIAFISNPSEERALRSSEFKVKIAQALYKSVIRFKNSYEMKRGLNYR